LFSPFHKFPPSASSFNFQAGWGLGNAEYLIQEQCNELENSSMLFNLPMVQIRKLPLPNMCNYPVKEIVAELHFFGRHSLMDTNAARSNFNLPKFHTHGGA